MKITLETETGIAVKPLLRYLAAHALPDCERVNAEHSSHSRVFHTLAGAVEATVTISSRQVAVDTDGFDADPIEIAGIARRWLDLDLDTASISDHFSGDALLGPLVVARPGLRLPGYPDAFEGAVMTVLGQQVSLAAARTFGGRLVSAFGTESAEDGLVSFPGYQRILEVPVDELREAIGVTGQRARTVNSVAQAFENGLSLSPDGDHARARAELLALPGIGPWSVEYLAMRALRDPDAFPSGDLVLRKAMGGVTAREAARIAEAWRPWRTYAVLHLWTAQVFAG